MRTTYLSRSNSIRFGVALALAGASFMAGAGTLSPSLTVTGTLTAACETSGSPAIAFGTLAALASGSDAVADTGSTFKVACSAGLAPFFWADVTRTLTSGANNIDFNLSMANLGANDLVSATGTALTLAAQDGTLQTVVVYGVVPKGNSIGKPNGSYTASIGLHVDY